MLPALFYSTAVKMIWVEFPLKLVSRQTIDYVIFRQFNNVYIFGKFQQNRLQCVPKKFKCTQRMALNSFMMQRITCLVIRHKVLSISTLRAFPIELGRSERLRLKGLLNALEKWFSLCLVLNMLYCISYHITYKKFVMNKSSYNLRGFYLKNICN